MYATYEGLIAATGAGAAAPEQGFRMQAADIAASFTAASCTSFSYTCMCQQASILV